MSVLPSSVLIDTSSIFNSQPSSGSVNMKIYLSKGQNMVSHRVEANYPVVTPRVVLELGENSGFSGISHIQFITQERRCFFQLNQVQVSKRSDHRVPSYLIPYKATKEQPEAQFLTRAELEGQRCSKIVLGQGITTRIALDADTKSEVLDLLSGKDGMLEAHLGGSRHVNIEEMEKAYQAEAAKAERFFETSQRLKRNKCTIQ